MQIAIDTNFLLLLVVGHASRNLVERHKRLKAYTVRDFDQLANVLSEAQRVVTTPNAMTEVSNLAPAGILEPLRSAIFSVLEEFSRRLDERYIPSRIATQAAEFRYLGLADSAWLCALDAETILLSADSRLCSAATARGYVAYGLADLRDPDPGIT